MKYCKLVYYCIYWYITIYWYILVYYYIFVYFSKTKLINMFDEEKQIDTYLLLTFCVYLTKQEK